MKSILRLYLNTSKGNDPFLHKQLLSFNIKPKYDDTFHAFYFDAPLPLLFKIAHQSLIAQNMHVQIGQPFPATSETVFMQRLQRIQFKNYLPLSRGLIQKLTLNILVRETKYPLSDNVMTSFVRNALEKQITKREYFREVLKGDVKRQFLPPFYEMRQIVERKWEQEDTLHENKGLLLDNHQKEQPPLIGSSTSLSNTEQSFLQNKKHSKEQSLVEMGLPFQPQLTLYIKRNKVRFLLKVNEQEMYKLGWKKKVGWAPVRQSIATAIISQTGILEQQKQNIIWDPFCGSGTIGLVAAAIYYGAKVRVDPSSFNWHHWAIFKPEYLKEYFESEQAKKEDKASKLKLICSDISFQAANYAVGNLKELARCIQKGGKIVSETVPVVKRIRPTEHWGQVMGGQWMVGCGDFQKLASNILLEGRKVNIVTNLPYLQSRSVDHMPLGQLLSVYKRFSKMLSSHRDRISNVFILIDSQNISNPNHFLSVSQQQWVIINSFQSGGKSVGLYAWEHNQLSSQHENVNALIQDLNKQAQIVNLVPDQQLTTALSKYRKKVADIQKKTYYLPEHLKKFKRGWRLVKEKRRRRHLLSAYELFAKRRDKMLAFSEYANKRLQVRMLKRGNVWRKRNMRLLTGLNIQDLEKQLKTSFEGKIQEALQHSDEREQYRRQRAKEANKQPSKTQRPVNPRVKARRG